jgi:hypothetical protein
VKKTTRVVLSIVWVVLSLVWLAACGDDPGIVGSPACHRDQEQLGRSAAIVHCCCDVPAVLSVPECPDHDRCTREQVVPDLSNYSVADLSNFSFDAAVAPDLGPSPMGCWALWTAIEGLGADIGAVVQRYKIHLRAVEGRTAPPDSLQLNDAAIACLVRKCGCSAVETSVDNVATAVHADCSFVRLDAFGAAQCIEDCLADCRMN